LTTAESTILLKKYWTIPVRQIESSVVLATADWKIQLTQEK
jgi:hypothetical protein